MSQLLNTSELTLIRYWLNNVPLDNVDDCVYEGKNLSNVLSTLRSRLILKARRLKTHWGDNWLDRKTQSDWLPTTLKRLEYLQQTNDINPDITQPLAYWLQDNYLEQLKPLALVSVSDWLVMYQSCNEKSWWKQIPGLGAITAKAIEEQIAQYFPAALTKTSLSTASIIYKTDIVPLTQFLVPEELNGTNGDNRSPDQLFIPADNDHQAIHCWLARLQTNSHTYRSYQREAERLLLWTILVKQKALSSLNMVDMSEYRIFLLDPQPAILWIGSPQKKKHTNWKPFTRPLSLRSRCFSETVLNGLFNFLVTQHYLLHNPLQTLVKLKNNNYSSINTHRSFTESQWKIISDFLDSRVRASTSFEYFKWLRTRLIVQIAYNTGLRLHELAKAKLEDLKLYQRQGQNQYWLTVLGKGQKTRDIPIQLSLYLLIAESYQQLTGHTLNRITTNYPIIPPLRGSKQRSLTPLAIHKIIKEAFLLAADDLKEKYPEIADKLQLASTHWLRHTHGSVAVEHNIPLTMIRDNLGHSNIATTSHYVHSDHDARHAAFTSDFKVATS